MTATLESPPVALAPSRSRRALFQGRTLVFAAILLSALTLRVAVTAFSPLAERIGQEIGYGATMVGIFGMVPTAMFGIFALATPSFMRRIGLERTALVAMALATAGMAARVFATDMWGLLATSALALGGLGIGNVVIPPLVKRYFSDQLATLSALYIMMVQLGTVVPAVAAVPAADAYGWRASLGMWSLLAAVAVVPWLVVVRARRGHDVVDTTAVAPAGRVRIRPWRSPLGWGMAAMFGMTSFVTYSLFTWVPKILTEAGASPAFGGNMVGLFALLGLVPALVMPTLCVRMANPFPLVLACAVGFFAGFAGLLLAPMSAPLLWIVLLGLGPGTFPMALTLINLRTRTQAGSAALSGFTQGAGYLIACLGPVLFGVLHSATGGWAWPFALLSIGVVIILAGAWQASKPHMLEDTLASMRRSF